MATQASNQRPSFVSLGMVVLDELRFPDRPTLYNVPGGSCAFSVLGARLVAGKSRASQVGCFILAGNDFPEEAINCFKSWDVNLSIKTVPSQPSTRGLLEYQDSVFGHKTFRYTTTPLYSTPKELPPNFLEAEAFHLLSRPGQVLDDVERLLTMRANLSVKGCPLLVWEPAPPYCKKDTKEEHMAAAKLVDVFSPNHLELLAFFKDLDTKDEGNHFDPREVEACADAFLESGIGSSKSGTIVVRAGEHGCLIASESIPGRHRWLPAAVSDVSKVVDATGGGNTFLGAFTFAMAAYRKSATEAAAMANVAASFALEQIGTPRLQKGHDGQEEQWNGSSFEGRYNLYRKTLKEAP